MNKRGWLTPILIVAINTLTIITQWSSLTETLPAHFDLEGNAGGTMPRSMLLIYPLIGIAACLIAYTTAQIKQKLQTGLIIATSGIGLILLSSTMVTLTRGTMPIFMLAEPAILLATIAGLIICIAKSRKSGR